MNGESTHAGPPRQEGVDDISADTPDGSPHYSSPPCYMHHTDFTPTEYLNDSDMQALIKDLMRLHFDTLHCVMQLPCLEDNSAQDSKVTAIGKDAAAFCIQLARHASRLGDDYSHSIPTRSGGSRTPMTYAQQLGFLHRRLSMIVVTLSEAIPGIGNLRLQTDLSRMCSTQLRNIAVCQVLLREIDA